MGKIEVTLYRRALSPLRHACYARLEGELQQLDEALESSKREHTRHAWAAFMQLERTTGLLDRIGWTEQDLREQVTLRSHVEIDIAVEALRDEAAQESESKAAALELGARDETRRATERELAIQEILSVLEAAQAGQHDAQPVAVVRQPTE